MPTLGGRRGSAPVPGSCSDLLTKNPGPGCAGALGDNNTRAFVEKDYIFLWNNKI